MDSDPRWPDTEAGLLAAQRELGAVVPPHRPTPPDPAVAGCFACLPRGYTGPGLAGDPVWAAAAVLRGRRRVAAACHDGVAAAPYRPGLLALRVGAALDGAVRALPARPDVLLVDATGLDHPRRAGLARHLGAMLDVPTVGVTHRPLLARGEWPADRRGATSPLWLHGAPVGMWLRTRAGRRPVAVHAGWLTDPEAAVAVVLACGHHRTPAPLREARRLARTRRSAATSA